MTEIQVTSGTAAWSWRNTHERRWGSPGGRTLCSQGQRHPRHLRTFDGL